MAMSVTCGSSSTSVEAVEGIDTPGVAEIVETAMDPGGDLGTDRSSPAEDVDDEIDDCLPMLLDTNFEVAAVEDDIQIHAAACFDGEAVWLVFNQKDTDGGSGFDVFATRIACDGTPLLPPFQVNQLAMFNETEPEIACGKEQVCFTWQSDNGQAPHNLDIYYRTYRSDGTPIMATDALLEVTVDGVVQTGNAWMSRVAPLPEERFAVVGAVAVDDSPFQTVVQRIHSTGETDGEAIVVSPDAGTGQVFPTVTSGPEGTIYVAWVDSPQEDPDFIRHSRLLPDSAAFEPIPGFPVNGTTHGGAPSYSVNLPLTPRPFLAFYSEGGGGASVLLYEGDTFSSEARHLVLGSDTAFDHSPAVAATPSGGAVVWYRNQSGFKNDVYFAGFQWMGDTITVSGDPIKLNDAAAPPYTPTVVPLSEDIFFVAWMEGANPDFRIKGRFIQQ